MINRDFNDLCHYGVRGMKRGVYGGHGRKYQNHAVYARFDKRYKRDHQPKSDEKAISDAVNKMGGEYFEGSRYRKDKSYKAKWDNAADVGTLAFVKNGRIAPGDDISDKDFNRKWFLFEDQTEDVAPIAYLVANCGYSSEDIKDLVYSANNNVKKNGKANELEYSLLTLGPTEAVNFARKCEEVMNEARQ